MEFAIGQKAKSKPRAKSALKRLQTIRAVYDAPDRVRRKFGLKRRRLSPSQKLLRMVSRSFG
ncbi:hypothetical protein D1224_04030 [Henriciella barbarensis]|uniref:Uncharacterized protein n=1 Tax=Henriciella barbarensis TaxID=86342 RepID=A0A399QY55_9PROT|nr:hypothetical protein D1224_04030 [Henriciella barbarensis]